MNRALRSLAFLVVSAASTATAQQPAPAPQGAPPQQAPAPLPPGGWRLDASHSAVRFRVRHLGVSWVNGEFKNFQMQLVYDPANPEAASVTATIPTATVVSGSDRRDADIRSGSYLAVDSFPDMTFVSRRVERAGANLRIAGDLTLRGVTRPVVLDAEVSGPTSGSRGKRIGFTATTTINRHDYGVVFNRLVEGAQVVGDEVRITIDIEATQPNS